MVNKPKQFVISAGQAGQNTLLIPEFAGMEILVSRRGVGDLLASEITVLPQGGFSLNAPDVFNEGDVFTVSPLGRSSFFPSVPVFPANQYPHLLQVTVLEPSTQNPTTGDWVPGASTVIEYPCRAEPAVSVNDGLRSAADGKVLSYGHTLFMPIGAPTLKVGAAAKVLDGDANEIASDTIKRFSRGQLNARAWL